MKRADQVEQDGWMQSAGLREVAATIALLFSAGMGAAQQPDSSATYATGRIQLDVVVTDASGKPVNGLQQGDFSVFDEGKQLKTILFAAFDGVKSRPDPPVEVILMIDALNNGFVEMGYIREGMEKYLRQNGGHLRQPTSIVRLSASGMETVSHASLDGNALADVVKGIRASTRPTGIFTFPPSMNALLRLAEDEGSRPGRKLLIWLGTGWPTPAIVRETFTAVDERDRRANYQMTVLISKALHDGHIVLYGGYTASEFYMRDYLKAARKASDLDPRALSLDVLAYKSGGRGELTFINRDSEVTDEINHFVAEGNAYYALSFNPPLAKGADEFHELKVTVDKPGLNVRTATGYYDQPEYYRPETKPELSKSLQQPAKEELATPVLVTVTQLTEFLQQEKTKRDAELAKNIERLQLTERLSSAKLTVLSAGLTGAKSKNALMAVGDASVFLDPPEAEIAKKTAPTLTEQRQMMSLTVDYLKKILPRLPDFYARRFTTAFEDIRTPKNEKGMRDTGALHPTGEFKATVYYQGGKEVRHAEGAAEPGLITQGTFGPIMSTAVVDAAHSTTQWGRWEEGANGPMAVFRFRVPPAKSHYDVSAGILGIGEVGAMGPTAYHGEIGIDPASGTIQRLVLEADPDLGSSIDRADIMVEYGAVAIGERTYTCPIRSVSISTGKSRQVGTARGAMMMREVTRLDDVVFSGYHVFRSEIRILPD